ncbi:CpsD/CapB family tyrosine-protein kinase [Candidatus Chloroploca asiatica]|uniref:Uncharacterized protein n=1 Tax=Candidatus Chloroploca asiatica TaxID=1506545 RepID=A0A2H3KR36_9CHLR|nr:CpsD/CapB family tyrosine-protein kinase [Candidatus Chloroploca asiatica]PDW00950.1 hypothetical protein A9Q02_21415 [Candidatus Chloroploca asiatica]
MRNLLLALSIGLLLGIGLAFGLEYLDYTVRSPDALELVYGTPTLGLVGMVETGQKGAVESNGDVDSAHNLTVSAPRSPQAEAIRSLRTSVQVAGLSRPLRSLLVTSSLPGEGKTFVSANLAVSMAQYGQTVILVDLDLRKPDIHQIFGIKREPGFTNLVLGNEARALASIRPQMQALVEQLRQRRIGKAHIHINPA